MQKITNLSLHQNVNQVNLTVFHNLISNFSSKSVHSNLINLSRTMVVLNNNCQDKNILHLRTFRNNFKNYQHYKFNHHSFSTTNKLNVSKEWTSIMNKAEKIVGYPTSFLNLRYLVSDEVANFANLLRKLMQTKHPLIKMARQLIVSNDNESKRSIQMNGLIVLLISKAAGVPLKHTNLVESDVSDGIHNSQRRLAEIAEMIYMGSLIHKGILDLKTVNSSELKDMDQGNKLAVLCGDYLLASACNNLSKLHNNQVVELMSEVIGEISQGIFSNSNSNNSFINQWYDNVNSDSSSLLANSAKSVMLLAQHSPKLQQVAWNFAKNLDLSHKIWSDLVDFSQEKSFISNNNATNILSAIYNEKYKNIDESRLPIKNFNTKSILFSNRSLTNIVSSYFSSNESTNTQSVVSEVMINHVVDDCKIMFNDHYNLALESLELLENEYSKKEAIDSLKSILNIMKNSINY